MRCQEPTPLWARIFLWLMWAGIVFMVFGQIAYHRGQQSVTNPDGQCRSELA